MTNIAKIFTLAATLVVGTGAISETALAGGGGSGIPAPYRIGNQVDGSSVSVPSFEVGSGIPAPYRIGN